MIPSHGRRHAALGWAAVVFVGVWVGGVAVLIPATGHGGATDRTALLAEATAALRDGDAAALHDLLLDAPDSGFSADYVTRIREAGSPDIVGAGPGAVEVRAGGVRSTLSVTEQDGRWYLSLLPPESLPPP